MGGVGIAPLITPDQMTWFENKTIAYYKSQGFPERIGRGGIYGIYGETLEKGVYFHSTKPLDPCIIS